MFLAVQARRVPINIEARFFVAGIFRATVHFIADCKSKMVEADKNLAWTQQRAFELS